MRELLRYVAGGYDSRDFVVVFHENVTIMFNDANRFEQRRACVYFLILSIHALMDELAVAPQRSHDPYRFPADDAFYMVFALSHRELRIAVQQHYRGGALESCVRIYRNWLPPRSPKSAYSDCRVHRVSGVAVFSFRARVVSRFSLVFLFPFDGYSGVYPHRVEVRHSVEVTLVQFVRDGADYYGPRLA